MPERATARQRRELGAIARYCVARIERELGAPDTWYLRVGPVDGQYACTVVVHDSGCAIETTSTEPDGALAIWDAICEIEQVLKDVRATRTERRPLQQFT